MNLAESLKKSRQKALFTQEVFAKELNVALSTVNRWETGKARPNLTKMKAIKLFCDKNGLSFYEIENGWLNFKSVENECE